MILLRVLGAMLLFLVCLASRRGRFALRANRTARVQRRAARRSRPTPMSLRCRLIRDCVEVRGEIPTSAQAAPLLKYVGAVETLFPGSSKKIRGTTFHRIFPAQKWAERVRHAAPQWSCVESWGRTYLVYSPTRRNRPPKKARL